MMTLREELCIEVKRKIHESKIISKENMQGLQDSEKKEAIIRYLFKSQA